MPCTICQHPKRQDIDQALVAGSATLAALSQEYGLSTSALHRHKAHLQAKVSRAQDQIQDNLRQGCLFWLSQAVEMATQTAQAAQAEGNGKLVLQAISLGTRLLNIMLKQDIYFDARVVYEILASPQWTTQASLLPHDPQILAAGRQALAGALLFPCPDASAQPSSPASLEDLDHLTENLLNLAQPAVQPKTVDRKLKTGNRHFNNRDKGGKLPGKTPSCKGNGQDYQQVKLYEKIAGSLGLLSPTRTAALQTPNSKLETLFSGKIPADMPLSEYIYEQNLKDNQDDNKRHKSVS